MGAHFEALDEGVLLVPLDPRYTQVGFNLVSVHVCASFGTHNQQLPINQVLLSVDAHHPKSAVTIHT